jgi:hypothetical protein
MADKKKIAEGRAVEAALANAKKAKDKFDSNFTGMSDKEKKRAAKGPMLKEFGQSMDGVRAGADSDVTNARKYGADAYKSRGFGQSNKDRPESKYSLRYAKGGKLEMVKKDGKSVPAFAADGVGKMNMGGMMGYKKGGKIDGIAMKGKTKGRMC